MNTNNDAFQIRGHHRTFLESQIHLLNPISGLLSVLIDYSNKQKY